MQQRRRWPNACALLEALDAVTVAWHFHRLEAWRWFYFEDGDVVDLSVQRGGDEKAAPGTGGPCIWIREEGKDGVLC